MNEDIAQLKLKEVKPKCQLFAMDYDGTLADGEKYKKEDAINLIKEILAKGKTPAFITARAATAVKTFVPPLEEHYKQNPESGPTFIAGGNGTVLYRLDAKTIKQIYNNGLSLAEVKDIVEKWQQYATKNLLVESLSEKGLITFQKFYGETWDHLIPEEVLNIGRPHEGRIFTEEAKVTFVFPKDVSRHEQIVADMQQLIGENFSVAAGDKDFCHITKRLAEDSKVVAIKTILQELGLNENQVATFGDMPHGNDAGLLSFPYSFTNYAATAENKAADKPPFILPGSDEDPVGSVYKAVRYLIDKNDKIVQD